MTPIDKKVKDYIEAQIRISNKADAAATSGFGIDPVLANLILENKLSSGSEKLYSIKVYNASETAIPDMILCKPAVPECGESGRECVAGKPYERKYISLSV